MSPGARVVDKNHSRYGHTPEYVKGYIALVRSFSHKRDIRIGTRIQSTNIDKIPIFV